MGLHGLPPGDTDWDRFAASWPVPFGALADVVVAAWDETDPVLLELCRLRMAALLTYPAEQARQDRARRRRRARRGEGRGAPALAHLTPFRRP